MEVGILKLGVYFSKKVFFYNLLFFWFVGFSCFCFKVGLGRVCLILEVVVKSKLLVELKLLKIFRNIKF